MEAWLPYLPIVLIPVLWLPVTTLLNIASGWRGLTARYPDRDEAPYLTLRWVSGEMGTVRMRGVLILGACPSGLRVDMFRPFNLFGRPFFVPWGELRVERVKTWFAMMATLRFGDGARPLVIPASVADRLAAASQGRWPEPLG